MKPTTISKLADWVTLITAPLTIAATLVPWTVRLQPERSSGSSASSELVAALLVTLIWCFFFAAEIRVFIKLRRTLSETGAFFASYLVGFIGLIMSTLVEALVIDSLEPDADVPLVMIGWMVVPGILWCIATVFAISLVISGIFEKDDDDQNVTTAKGA